MGLGNHGMPRGGVGDGVVVVISLVLDSWKRRTVIIPAVKSVPVDPVHVVPALPACYPDGLNRLGLEGSRVAVALDDLEAPLAVDCVRADVGGEEADLATPLGPAVVFGEGRDDAPVDVWRLRLEPDQEPGEGNLPGSLIGGPPGPPPRPGSRAGDA